MQKNKISENIYFFLTSLTLGCFSFIHSQKIIEPKKINDNQINLDGIINKEEWKNASKVSLDYEFKPGYNTPPDKNDLLHHEQMEII